MSDGLQVFGHEVHALFVQPFLDEMHESMGAQAVAQFLAPFGVGESALRNRAAWITLAFADAFCERMYQLRGDPALFDRCGRMVMTRRYFGILRPLFRSFGSPAFTYVQLARATPLFNKVGRMTVLEQRPGFARLEYRAREGAPRERSPLVCLARSAQLCAVPTLFDEQPAEARHPRCMHKGADVCVYELTWRERPRRRVWLGTALGAAAAAVGGVALGFSAMETGVLAAVAAGAGWALARSVDLAREVAERSTEIFDYHEALTRSAHVTDERFAELQGAKADVERHAQELRRTSEQLKQALEEVRALDRAKTDFFANVSHDLRTPLTLILGPLAQLRAGLPSPESAETALLTIQHNAERLHRLIDHMLELARVDAGRTLMRRLPVEPARLARTVGAQFTLAARGRGLDLVITAPEDVPAFSLDARWIESAITNLLDNALRHARTRIELRVSERPDSGLVLTVEDDGAGIPPGDLALVFERFAQGSASDGRKGSSGLGLAIVKEAARLHGGDAAVESEAGLTRFRMILPRWSPGGRVDEETDHAGPGPAPPRAATREVPRSWPGPGPAAPRVLIVEDDDDLRGFVGDVLATRYQVQAATDGETAIAWARAHRPDAVVSDVAMPGMSGYDLCRALKADPGTAAIPVLLLTAYRDGARVLEAFEAGAMDFLPKPFQPAELLARVDVHVRVRRLMREVAHAERLSMLGLLAASVAHQVRNPLGALTAGLEATRRKLGAALGARDLEMYEVMLDAVARVERLTRDLLNLSRVDRADEGTLVPAEGIRAALRLLAVRLPTTVQIEVDLDEEVTLFGRPTDLHHVFLNLLDNAARAVADRGTVRVSGRSVGDDFVFSVDDSGPGVPADLREWIFQPFASTRAAGDGTGLGLTIVRRVVEDHGGTVDVQSGPLGGARFTVRLPLGRSSQTSSATGEAAAAAPASTRGNDAASAR